MRGPILDLEIPLLFSIHTGALLDRWVGPTSLYLFIYFFLVSFHFCLLFLFSVSFHFCLLLSRLYLFSSICGAHLQSTSTSCGPYWWNFFNFVMFVLHVPCFPACVVVLNKTIPWYVVHQWMNWSISEHKTSLFLFYFSYFAWINANGDWWKMIIWQWVLLDI